MSSLFHDVSDNHGADGRQKQQRQVEPEDQQETSATSTGSQTMVATPPTDYATPYAHLDMAHAMPNTLESRHQPMHNDDLLRPPSEGRTSGGFLSGTLPYLRPQIPRTGDLGPLLSSASPPCSGKLHLSGLREIFTQTSPAAQSSTVQPLAIARRHILVLGVVAAGVVILCLPVLSRAYTFLSSIDAAALKLEQLHDFDGLVSRYNGEIAGGSGLWMNRWVIGGGILAGLFAIGASNVGDRQEPSMTVRPPPLFVQPPPPSPPEITHPGVYFLVLLMGFAIICIFSISVLRHL
ncbi:uncharacterized protein LOC107305391 isoform X1 [Oryza brachyantha]|uniref:uncharacterized protein LOC107305391 isoform X1 n=1 Tax=Oryza brachyantha TaxID=4533 RepID=UPI001ADD17FA|nr:uncharacterized protein LOC107305391 isoform X1 [Oryza brachyantha]XP_040385665.1 uncharacterized protein LOC107305391 isoform X1 [Oryza brachyantha]